MKKLLFGFVLSAAVLVASCTPANVGKPDDPGTDTPEDTVDVSGDGSISGVSDPIFLACDANSSRTFKQNFGSEWTISSEDEWISVSPESGKDGAATITVTANSANEDFAEKIGRIAAKTTSDEKEWWVIQRGPEGFAITDQSTTYNGESQIEVNVVAHNLAEFSIENGTGDWASIVSTEETGSYPPLGDTGYTSSYCAKKITIMLYPNPDTKERTGTYTLKGGESEYVITVTQPAAGYKPFFKRSVAMRFSGTWCSNCPMMAESLYDTMEQYPERFIPMNLYNNTPIPDPSDIEEQLNYKDIETFTSHFGIYGYPTGLFNGFATVMHRSTESNTERFCSLTDESARLYPASSGIAARSSISGNKVSIDADITVMEDKEYSISAFILEDNIIGPQVGAPDPEHYTHNFVTRSAFHSSVLGDRFESTPGETTSISMSCNLESYINKDNAYILIFVTYADEVGPGLVQDVSYGNFGYTIDNAVTLPLSGSVELEYE